VHCRFLCVTRQASSAQKLGFPAVLNYLIDLTLRATPYLSAHRKHTSLKQDYNTNNKQTCLRKDTTKVVKHRSTHSKGKQPTHPFLTSKRIH
jgi:hypothetical protein